MSLCSAEDGQQKHQCGSRSFKSSIHSQSNAYDYTVQLKLSVKNKPACTYDSKQLQKAGGNTSLEDRPYFLSF